VENVEKNPKALLHLELGVWETVRNLWKKRGVFYMSIFA
jgi:hypothetical protein